MATEYNPPILESQAKNAAGETIVDAAKDLKVSVPSGQPIAPTNTLYVLLTKAGEMQPRWQSSGTQTGDFNPDTEEEFIKPDLGGVIPKEHLAKLKGKSAEISYRMDTESGGEHKSETHRIFIK
ncbi:hypothetical protein [Pseudomonas pergaminensis]|uniref:Uncharacterized protein n=1 Tax=Pseudomonas pergaminensis TaxID=2853159 RepID=A0ABW8QVY4_9PSED|nr:hypothetical protein [Pseudomonas sp.]